MDQQNFRGGRISGLINSYVTWINKIFEGVIYHDINKFMRNMDQQNIGRGGIVYHNDVIMINST